MKKDIQGLMDHGILKVSTKCKENEITVIVPHFYILEPLKINYQSKESGVTPLIICLPGPILYEFDKVVTWRYNATVLEDGKEVMIEACRFVENIAYLVG